MSLTDQSIPVYYEPVRALLLSITNQSEHCYHLLSVDQLEQSLCLQMTNQNTVKV